MQSPQQTAGMTSVIAGDFFVVHSGTSGGIGTDGESTMGGIILDGIGILMRVLMVKYDF